MKILHVVQSIHPSYGGPAVSVPSLAAAQASLGHSVSLAYLHQVQGRDEIENHMGKIPGTHKIGMAGVSRMEVLKAGLGGYVPPGRLPARVKESDIVHLHGVWDPLLLVTARLARHFGKEYVIAPRGMLNTWSLAQKRLKKKVAMGAIVRRNLDLAGFIHALNQNEKEEIAAMGLESDIRVFPNGIFLEHLKSEGPESGVSRYAGKNGRRYVLFMGRLHKVKGLDYLADAFQGIARRIENVDLVVAGPNYGERAAFESMVSEYGMEDRVHVVGPLYGANKYVAMRGAECFFLPSRQEGFSMAVIEAMACGTPSVISESTHFPEAGRYGAAEVVPLDGRAMEDAIFRILNDRAYGRHMGELARELVFREYTWDVIAGRLVDAYSEVCSSGRRTAARMPDASWRRR